MHTQVYKSRHHNRFSVLAFLILAVVSISGLLMWRLQSVQLLTVESTSMAPEIRKGDAIVIRSAKTTELKVGDVVSYRSPADQSVIITHRIVNLNKTWGLVITKGDNVARNDKPLPVSEIVGRVDLKVAYAGFAVAFLRSPAGLIAAVYLPAAIVVSVELKRLAGHYTKPTYRLKSYAKS